MLKAYPSVMHTSLILHGYQAQLSMVASYIDMISVIFIRGKLLKLHAPMSIHTTSVSPETLEMPNTETNTSLANGIGVQEYSQCFKVVCLMLAIWKVTFHKVYIFTFL